MDYKIIQDYYKVNPGFLALSVNFTSQDQHPESPAGWKEMGNNWATPQSSSHQTKRREVPMTATASKPFLLRL